MRYPESPRGDVVETLHGEQIADPYRWLEHPDSDETRAWVEAQRAFGEQYLESLPARGWFRRRMRALLSRPRAGLATKRGPFWFVTRNDGTRNQDVWFIADTLEELRDGGRIFVDPNEWSDDGTSSLAAVAVSDDGRYATLSRSDAGSDWHRVSVVEVATMKPVGEPLITKFSVPVWLPDSRSFLIHRYPDVGTAQGSDTQALTAADLVIHRVDGGDDEVLWANPGDPMLFTEAHPSHDGRWLIQSQSWGTERSNSLAVYPLRTDAGRTRIGERIDVAPERQAMLWWVRTDGDQLVVETDLDAPLGRLVRLAIAPDATPEPLLAEGNDPIGDVAAFGDELLVTSSVDVTPRVTRYALDGRMLGEVEIEAGASLGCFGRPGERYATVAVTSVTQPLTTWVVDAETGRAEEWPFVASRAEDAATATPEVRVERHRATSADGTQIPYWQVDAHPEQASGPRPVLVYGYGGFSSPVQLTYSAGFTAWLQAGGIVAICNLRGGSEFGRAWYDDGRGAHKQHVFDDVIAIGEDLVARGVSSPEHLAVYGRSNGGLLVGAALTQRPDLWACALPQVGVLDLLRFHKFTGGLAWASDYGNPDQPEDFAVARAYSPLHNVRPGTHYPPTLILTGDHDDRVVPLHSHKFTAALQHAQAGDEPIIERVEVATGHGMGKPVAMQADEWADLLAFAAEHTGLTPRDVG